MKIYHYDRLTRELLRESDARPSPLEPGKFLFPRCATDKIPPDPAAGRAVCFINDAWAQVEDNRGGIYYSKETGARAEIKSLGKIPETLTALEPIKYGRWNGSRWVVDNELQAQDMQYAAQKELRDLDLQIAAFISEIVDILISRTVINETDLSGNLRSLLQKKKELARS